MNIPFIVQTHDAGKSIYTFLKCRDLSSNLIRSLKKDGRIHLNGHSVHTNAVIHEGDLIELYLPEESSDQLVPEKIDFEVLYEDANILVINKPAGIPVHPTFNYKSGTLANAVMYYWQSKGVTHRFRAMSRLDKDTSGIILIALNLYAYNRLSTQQVNNGIGKKYMTIVHGQVLHDEGEIHLPIGRKAQSIIEREVRADGQEAITHYKVVERFAESTLLEVQLVTGRTHQIRVHFSHIGHPLVGDDLYGGKQETIKRQALHASSLTFNHPRTDVEIEITSSIPTDMIQLLQHYK